MLLVVDIVLESMMLVMFADGGNCRSARGGLCGIGGSGCLSVDIGRGGGSCFGYVVLLMALAVVIV